MIGRLSTYRLLLIPCCVILLELLAPIRVGAMQEPEVIAVADAETRKWSSNDGKFSVDAKLIEILPDKVRLDAVDGRRLIVELKRLSKVDNEYVAQIKAKMAAAADNPFQEMDPFGAQAMETALGMTADWSDYSLVMLASENLLNAASERWQPGPPTASKGFQFPVPTIHTSVSGFCTDGSDQLMAVSLSEPFGVDFSNRSAPARSNPRTPAGRTGNNEQTDNRIKGWVEFYKLPAGKLQGRFPLGHKDEKAVDIDVGRQLLLTVTHPITGKSSVAVYHVANDGIKELQSWTAANDSPFPVRLQNARFLANGDVLTVEEERLVVWDPRTAKAKFGVPTQHQYAKLSTDRRHVLVQWADLQYEVDLFEGVCTAAERVDSSTKHRGAPSPDGTRFASFKNRALSIQSKDGQEVDEFYLPVMWPEQSIRWLDDRFLLMTAATGKMSTTVDTVNRVALLETVSLGIGNDIGGPAAEWKHERFNTGQSNWAVRFVPVNANPDGAPSPEALARRLPAQGDDLLVFLPGDRVRLTLRLAADPGRESEIEQLIRALLDARGVIVDDTATDELVAASSTTNQQVDYQSTFAFFGDSESVNVTTTTRSLTLIRRGKPVWAIHSNTGPGFMLLIREGETAQQAADRQSRGGEGFWRQVQLPRHVAQHPEGGPWFRATQTLQGTRLIDAPQR